MLGIEALLIEGNQSITDQFRQKSILILGEPKEFKKKLSKLYDYRSKLIHGRHDIFPRFYKDYSYVMNENHVDKGGTLEYFEQLNFATSILLALIRELIIAKKDCFEFEFQLKR